MGWEALNALGLGNARFVANTENWRLGVHGPRVGFLNQLPFASSGMGGISLGLFFRVSVGMNVLPLFLR